MISKCVFPSAGFMVYCIVILMGLLTSGCISVFNSHEQQFSVSCSEQDAIIYINGEKYTNPVTVTLPRNKEVNIRVEKEGFTPYITTIPNQLSGYGLGDVITSMFLIIPVTGLLTPGAWELVETDLKVKLYKAH